MLTLRPYEKEDANAVVSWITDEHSFYRWSAGRLNNFPLTTDVLNTYYDDLSLETEHCEYTMVDDEGRPVGHFCSRILDGGENFRMGFIIVDSTQRGKGLGKEMLRLALERAFEFPCVKRVTLGVFENNPSAYKCYKSVGFQECGESEYVIKDQTWRCIELIYNK